MAYTPDFKLTVNGTAPNQHTTDQLLNVAVNAALTALYNVVSGELGEEKNARIAEDILRNQYSTRVYPDRATAVADIANLVPGQTTRIATIEGQSLCWRAPYQGADDPLSATSPYWGVVLRQNVAQLRDALPVSSVSRTYNSTTVSNDATGTVYTATSPNEWLALGLSVQNAQIISFIPPNTNLGPAKVRFDGSATEYRIVSLSGEELTGGELKNVPYIMHRWGTTLRVLTEVSAADLADGRIWMATGSLITPAGLTPPKGTKMIVTRTTTSNLVRTWRQGNAPADGIETDILAQDALGQWWQRVMDYDAYYTRRLVQGSSILSLYNPTGGGDDVSIEYPNQYGEAGLTGIAGTQVLSYTPTATNLTENPTIEFRNVAPGVKYSLVGGSGGNLPVMFFQIGRTYFLQLRGLTARVVAGEGSGIDGMTAISTTAASELCTNAGKRNPRAYENTGTGIQMDDAVWASSGLLPVTKGEFYRIYSPILRQGISAYSLVDFFDQSEAFAGSLVYANLDTPIDAAVVRLGFDGFDTRYRFHYLRVPQDGFLRLSLPVSIIEGAFLQKVSVDAYVQDHMYLGDKSNIEQFLADGVLQSPLWMRLGYCRLTTLIGSDTPDRSFGAISAPIAVKAGQYLQAFTTHIRGAAVAIRYDADGNEVEVIGAYGPDSRSSDDTVGGFLTIENKPIPVDGTIRLIMDAANVRLNDGAFVALTTGFHQYSRKFTESQSDPMRLDGVTPTANMALPATIFAANALYTTIGPVHCRAGEILRLEYVLSSGGEGPGNMIRQSKTAADNPAYRAVRIPNIGMVSTVTTNNERKLIQFVSAKDAPFSVLLNSKIGTGSVRVVSAEEFRAERRSLVAAMQPTPNMFPTPGGRPTGAASTEGDGIGYLPVLDGEVVKVKSKISRMWSIGTDLLPNTLYFDQDTKFLRPQSSLGVIYANTYADEDYVIYRHIGLNGYVGFGFQLGAGAANYLKAGDIDFFSPEEWEAYCIAGKQTVSKVTGFRYNSNWTAKNNPSSIGRSGADLNWKAGVPFPVKAGQFIKWASNCDTARISYMPFILEDNGDAYTARNLMQLSKDAATTGGNLRHQATAGFWKVENDGYVVLNQRMVPPTVTEVLPATIDARISKQSQMKIEMMTEREYEINTRIFDGDCLQIPDPKNLVVKVYNNVLGFDNSAAREYSAVLLQLWQAGAHLCNVSARFEVQGQGSAGSNYYKFNQDLKVYNAKGDRISMKVGDWKESRKFVFKAAQTEFTHARDIVSPSIWRDMRRANPYPRNVIFDPAVYDQLATFPEAKDLHDAVCSTQGVTCSMIVGDVPNGIYTLRTKKDEINYAVQAENENHIWMQSDYLIFGGQNLITWTALDWKQWEITQPDFGDDPGTEPTNAFVKASITRFFEWIRACVAEEVSFKDTYAQYIHLESWMDYLLAAELINHWDGRNNNVIMSTIGNGLWSVFLYDCDWTLGARAGQADTKIDPTSLGLIMNSSASSCGIWWLLHKYMAPEIAARWAALRSGGVLSAQGLSSKIRDVASQVPETLRATDAYLWGRPAVADPMYIIDWTVRRMQYLDTRFGYGA